MNNNKRKEKPTTYRITDLEINDRPRERLAEKGAYYLKDEELIAILLRTGLPGMNAVQVGQHLLQELGGLAGIHRASFEEVCDQPGIGPAKAAQIKAAIELGRRLNETPADQRTTINSPQDAANLVKYQMSALDHEELHVLVLNTRNQVIKKKLVYRGSLDSTQVRIAELFKEAVILKAAAILVIHNHPSGDPSPSPEDVAITREIIKAGQFLNIKVLDHLIIGGGRYISLKERKLGFE